MVLRNRRPYRSAVRMGLAAMLVSLLAMAGLAPASAASSGADVPASANLLLASVVTLDASPNPALVGQDVSVVATIAEIQGNPIAATGSVTLFDGSTVVGVATLAGASAVWTTQLTEGTHNLTAAYGGDDNYKPGVSAIFALSVTHSPSFVTISFPGSAGANLTTDGTTVGATVTATSPAGGVDLPKTRFNVSFPGISALTNSNMQLQQLLGSDWVDVPLTGSPLAGTVGDPSGVELAPGTSVTVPLRFTTQRGSPLGVVNMTTELVGSTDGGSTYPNQLSGATQAVNIIRLPTTTTVAASSVLTNNNTAPIPMHATVTPSIATGTVTFLDNGVVVGVAAVSNGTANLTTVVHLGTHLITATYSGDDNLYGTSTTLVPTQITVTPAGGAAHALPPRRILDTRNGIGAPKGVGVPANGKIVLQVAGAGNLPASNIEAAILNMTIRTSTAGGYITMYASDQPAPYAASLSFDSNVITAGLTIVPVSASGSVTIANHSAKPINLLADANGYFASQLTSITPGGRYNGFAPFRLLDTSKTPMKANGSVTVKMTGRSSGASKVPTTGVASVMLELTGTNPSDLGYITAYPGLTPVPDASVLNFSAHVTRSNRVIVAVGTDGTVVFRNSKWSSVGLFVEVVGYFTSDASTAGGTTYVPLTTAKRLMTGNWKANQALGLQIAGQAGIPPITAFQPPQGVIANITAKALTANTTVTVYPGGTRPAGVDLVLDKGRTVSNMAIAKLNGGRLAVYNQAGTLNVAIDVFGWFG